jgi:hypothetical protein
VITIGTFLLGVGLFLAACMALAVVEFLAARWHQRRPPQAESDAYVLIVVTPEIAHHWTLTRDRKKAIYSSINLTQERRALTALAEKTAWLN